MDELASCARCAITLRREKSLYLNIMELRAWPGDLVLLTGDQQGNLAIPKGP